MTATKTDFKEKLTWLYMPIYSDTNASQYSWCEILQVDMENLPARDDSAPTCPLVVIAFNSIEAQKTLAQPLSLTFTFFVLLHNYR